MLQSFVALSILSVCTAQLPEQSPKNVITVPPNCPDGQEWINGACRDIWISAVTAAPSLKADLSNDNILQSVISVPPNCLPDQEFVNGQCRELWRGGVSVISDSNIDTKNMVTVPPNCPPGQQWINGQCRDIWRGGLLAYLEFLAKSIYDKISIQTENNKEADKINELEAAKNPFRIISVPNQCPAGYRLDALGICRRIL